MNTRTIVIIFAVLVLVAFVIGIAKDSTPSVSIPTVPVATAPTTTEYCYYSSTKASTGLYDRTLMRITETNGRVTGDFRMLPAEKDSKSGTFDGTSTGGIATLIWHTQGEGMTADEELLIKYNEMSAQAAFGEMIRGANGVYVYKDKSRAVYQTLIPATDCTTLDEVLAVEKYIRTTDLSTLTKESAVLGGKLFVTSVVADPMMHTAMVSFEDGHNAFKGMVNYSYDPTTKKVTVNTYTKGN